MSPALLRSEPRPPICWHAKTCRCSQETCPCWQKPPKRPSTFETPMAGAAGETRRTGGDGGRIGAASSAARAQRGHALNKWRLVKRSSIPRQGRVRQPEKGEWYSALIRNARRTNVRSRLDRCRNSLQFAVAL